MIEKKAESVVVDTLPSHLGAPPAGQLTKEPKTSTAGVQKTRPGARVGGSLKKRLRLKATERAEASSMREALRLDTIDRRTADRVLAYARREGFDRDEPRGWATRTGVRILDQSAAVVLEHMRREGRPPGELRALGQLMATWCRWGCWATATAPAHSEAA